MNEIDDAYRTVGILIRAKIEQLCNQHKFDDAHELESGYNIINKYTDNSLAWKGITNESKN